MRRERPFRPTDARFTGQTLTVRLRTVSEVIAEPGIQRIHLLKVNVEKAELDLLRGIHDEDWASFGPAGYNSGSYRKVTEMRGEKYGRLRREAGTGLWESSL